MSAAVLGIAGIRLLLTPPRGRKTLIISVSTFVVCLIITQALYCAHVIHLIRATLGKSQFVASCSVSLAQSLIVPAFILWLAARRK